MTVSQQGKGRLLYLPEIIKRTGMPEGTIRSKRHAGTMPCIWKLGRRLVAWEVDLSEWLDRQREATAKTGDENVTWLEMVVRWNPREDEPYYLPSERVSRLQRWIGQALDDRDDSPTFELREV